MEVFIELSLLIAISTLIAGVMKILKQPLIIGYILAGIMIGPYAFNFLNSENELALFSHIGIALLLFIVGLRLSPKVIKEIGKVSLITGVGQVAFTSIVGFFIGTFLGFSFEEAMYIAVALTFSSTIIIMKLLTDKDDTESLYGRIAIGFLIVQDIIAIFILMAISSMSGGLDLGTMVMETLLEGFGMLVLLFLIGIYVMPKLTTSIAKSQEFLLLFSISWCFALASLFYHLNFSMEIGALLAGITLSLSPYRFEISSKLRPLRDFFIVLFFIFLGAQMSFSDIEPHLLTIFVFSAFILIGNPIIVMLIMGGMGYTKRNGFLAGLTVAQISEFSLILIALGVSVGDLTNEILSIVTAVGLITIAGSSYMILYSDKIYPKISKYLGIFERRGKKVDEHKYQDERVYDSILFGYDRIGFDLLESLKRIKNKFLVIDYNPETVVKLARDGVDCRYGDADDVELLGELNLSKVKMVISTIKNFDTNMLLINKIREVNKDAIVIVVSHQTEEAMELYERGATYVIMPHFLGGQHASMLIENYEMNLNKFLEERLSHIKDLKEKRDRGHKHPTPNNY
jgi:Kef-type K+ transport system membrane component KefB